MQSSKHINALFLLVVTGLGAWGLWQLPSILRADAHPLGPTFQKQWAMARSLHPNGDVFGLEVAGISIGIASIDPKKDTLDMFLVDRMGTTLTLHELNVALRTEDSPHLEARYRLFANDQIILESSRRWLTKRAQDVLTLEPIPVGQPPLASGLPAPAGPGIDPDQFLALTQAFDSGKHGGSGAKMGPAPAQDDLKATLNTQTAFPWPHPLTLTGGNKVVFNPILFRFDTLSLGQNGSEDRGLSIQARRGLPVDFRLLSSPAIGARIDGLLRSTVSLRHVSHALASRSDLESLTQVASECSAQMAQIQKRSLNALANVPFLLQRKVSLMLQLCRGAANFALESGQSQSPDAAVAAMQKRVRPHLTGSTDELPRALVKSPHWPVLFQNDQHTQWARILEDLLNDAVGEIADSVSFEEQRKIPARIQVVLRGRSLGTVVKGVIQGRDLDLATGLELAQPPQMLAESLRSLPKEPPTSAGAAYVDGRYGPWTSDRRAQINALCLATGGRLGIDLGDAAAPSQGPLWGDGERLGALQMFLHTAASAPSCRNLVARTPPSLQVPAQQVLDAFRAEVMQTNQELQLTNSRLRNLNLIPGRYEIFVSSMVNGTLLDRFEFDVKRQKKPQTVTLTIGKSGDVIPEEPAETD
jgi:hypothetical protein